MKKVILNIEGMTCSACSNGLEKFLSKQDGIISVSVNLVMATALIEYDEKLTVKDLNRFVKEAGFKSLGEKKEKNNNANFVILIVFSILGIILMYISMGQMFNLPIPNILNMVQNPKIYAISLMLLSLLFIFYGFDIIKNGFKNIVHKMPNMDSLVGVGVIVNFVYSLWNTVQVFMGNTNLVHHLYFESSAIIILFVKVGRFIDKKNKDKAVDTIKNLVTITPKKGTILKDNKEIEVNINEIEKGDIVVSKPGEKIASGVANPKAHGQATTKTLTNAKIASLISVVNTKLRTNATREIINIVGTKYPLILSATLAIGAFVFVASTTIVTIFEMLESFPILSALYFI